MRFSKQQSFSAFSRCPICNDPCGITGGASDGYCRSCGWDTPSDFEYDNEMGNDFYDN